VALEIFKLVGSIMVDNSAADKSLAKTDKKASSVGSTMAKGVKSAAKFGGGMVGAAGIAASALTALGTKTAEHADNIDEMSVKLGMSKKAYQEWDFIMSQNGVSIESMSTGMKSMTTSMSSLAEGGAKGKETLGKLGITLDDLKNKSQEEIFEQSVKSLQKMPAGYEKARLAQQLFGKQGQEMLPILNATKGTVDELKKKANDMGVVMSDKAVSSGAKLGDTLDALKMAGMGLFNSLGSSLVPIIQKFADFIIANMPMIQEMFTQMAPIISEVFAKLVPPIMEMVQTLMPVLLDVIMQLMPFVVEIMQKVLPVITNLMMILLPPLMQIIQELLPLLMTIITPLLPLLEPIVMLLEPIADLLVMIIKPIAKLLNWILPPLIKMISGQLTIAIGSVKEVIGAMKTYFTGIIDFITGVFTGDWKKAWGGVVKIFSGIWDGMVAIFKYPLNTIIGGINSFISSINKIKIPDWVPSVGGKGFSFKAIPLLAKGGTFTSGSAVVGEAGAELITLKGGRAQVTPLTSNQKGKTAQSGNVFNFNIKELHANNMEEADKIVNYMYDKFVLKVQREEHAY